MPKGYWIAHGTVDDLSVYDEYRKANAAPLAAFGGKFLVRGGTRVNPEGEARPRSVVIEFPSYQAALDCYHSPEYRAALAIRAPVSASDLVIIEGYDG